MIFFVVTETDQKYRNGAGAHKVKLTLEKYAKDMCMVLHYSQLSRKLIEALRPWAICHSGGGTPHDEYDVLTHRNYRWVTRSSGIPQMGFCGGHQIIAAHYGGVIAHMRLVRPDEPDYNPAYYPGHFKESGYYPVRILKRDPLFKGLPKVIRVREAHRSEVRELPPVFELLASTKDCRVQAYVHKRKPIYGTQFHPEGSIDEYPHGFTVLRNFFGIAREYRDAQSDRA